MRFSVWSSLAVFVLLASPLLAQTPSTSSDSGPNMRELKKESEIFENIINTALRQAVPHPMLIAEKARGSYLEGYGIAFTMTINLNRKLIIFPKSKSSDKADSSKDPTHEFMVKIRRTLTSVLGLYGDTIKQLNDDAHISIVVHVLSRSVINNENFTRIMVLSTTKNVIAEHRRKLNSREFHSKVHYIEY
jgi:hypothetical protein